eukprot:CAMPEP_0168186888 /NCGR_PEP_ID=MMETSP0139_2-20121125/14695_1 /TAXON_ID=44445 /ORGANISM="Pseudo-nitzschia australis, Strain 10249 10 AB" /LENGTH=1127 /DNA_ID=CAMNT_0008108971 /DNA_START=171 /DNA_END=3554 /DNA_ORIENTATION=+
MKISLCALIGCWTMLSVPATAFIPAKSNVGSHPRNAMSPTTLFRHTISTTRGRPLKAEEDKGKTMPAGLRPDTQIEFGSGEEDDEEDDYDNEENEYQRKRDEIVQKALDDQDKEFKEERRRKVWGEFADAKTAEDIEKVKQALKEKIDKENQLKATLAKNQGVDMEVLEAPQSDGGFFDASSSEISISGFGGGKNWYDNLDEDLKQEWAAMGGNDRDNSSIEDEEASKDQDESSSAIDDTVAIDGKIVSRDRLKGVRVGSAGGWSLEVFPGDFVVHRKYGIGRFEKTTTTPRLKLTRDEVKARDARRKEIITEKLRSTKGGVPQEMIQAIQAKFGTEEDTDQISNPQVTVLEITYADGIVHVPVDRAYRLSRYRAGDAAVKPRLSKVRGDQWRNARRKVEASTLELAQDVLALYATRETLQRPPFNPDNEYKVKEFEKTFTYEPTKDQAKCFEDVENDMVWRPRPMDRLICGDVGFGKTEVALRALYRSVANGRQAAMLAPTGVLASQHFKNILKRVGEESEFKLSIALLRGGMSPKSKAGKEMRSKIKNGEYDIIVGTHALLSNSMEFKDLGLLVVDEEQRFGVKQKERLKLICNGIDVLTLSATPIPRTLQMSLSGIRDTSTIRSPPPMRKSTKTFVQSYNKDLVKHAIGQELGRGGQIFYVVPRIALLDEAEETIRECFPDIKVIQAHGRMGRNIAEDNVSKFAEGGIDILLATTVIENGVDIPSVNTIIIQDSQNFGMSTLYQLRGRVGRSDKQGYAYFLHNEDAITEQSVMRLQAIGELNELGSGFDVANRDLEIRGAGSLLGTEQSGAAARVGFDLYMRMLKKSIRQLRGLDVSYVPRTNILLPKGQGSMEVRKKDESGNIISLHAFQIPEDFMPDENERRIAETSVRLADSSTTLVELTNKWKDEYGPLPASLQRKLKTMHLHASTRRLGIDVIGLVENEDGEIDCVMRSTGLRPRHWGKILSLLPRGVSPKGLDVIFPARFTLSGDQEEIVGGKRIDLKRLLEDSSLDEDTDKWDALDEEEVEAMKEIASAYNIERMDEIDIEFHPRFVMKNFNTGKQAVDRLLKVLLPIARTVYQQQEKEKENAKNAVELRDKRLLLEQRRKESEERENQKFSMDGMI